MTRMKHIYKVRLLVIATIIIAAFAKCDDSNPNVQRFTDSQSEGTIHISVDESFKPIIDSQIQVFESQFPKAKIIAEYKAEAECIKDLDKDSTRLIIVTRKPNQDEISYFQKKIGVSLTWDRVAFDAMTIVVNKQSKDTLFSLTDLKSILAGTFAKPYKVVMDGLTATSNVRFALDSILRGLPFGKNVQAASNSQGVIEYVSKTPDAIGFVGVSWVGTNDADQLSFSDKVTVARLQCDSCPGTPYVLPYQANMAAGRYSLIRGLYVILKENGLGLGGSFEDFLKSPQKGQLIFKRAYLLPAMLSYEIRKMEVDEGKK